MRLNIPGLILASGVATLASHSVPNKPLVNHANTSFLQQNRLIVEQLPPNCNLAACVGLSGTITCVISAITLGDPGALQRCITNGLTQICSCAACIPAVSNFLMSLGICVTSPTPPNGNNTFDAAWASAMTSFQTKASSAMQSVSVPTSTSLYDVSGPVFTSSHSV